MARKYRIGLIRGDGIGPEITEVALEVLNVLLDNVEIVELGAGYNYLRRYGRPFQEDIVDVIKGLDAVLKGPLTTLPGPGTYRSINVYLRQELDLYANVRPFTSFRGVSQRRFNFVIIRENTEGLYSGIEGRFKDYAFTLRIISEFGAERISNFAFRYAISEGFKKVTVVHKANILKESDGLFRNKFFEVAKKYEGIEVSEMFVDAAAYNLIRNPEKFEVIVTPNLYGDILSDEAAGLVGSLGLCGSAQIGDKAAIFEPVHGSAPDIAGKGIANPIGELMALTLMLKYLWMKFNDETLRVSYIRLFKSIKRVVEDLRVLTPDLGGSAKTVDIGKAVIETLRSI